MRLTVLGIALLASASAIGEGYITSVRLPDGTTKTFQDAGARQEIQDILSQKYLKPESVKAGDNVSVTTNESGEVTISADISSTSPAFSNAVLSVGLGIDTNTVAAINELVDSSHGLPVTGAASVGALLLALAAAIAALKRGKADKPATFTTGNLAALDAQGNPTDSGISKDNLAGEVTILGKGASSTITTNSAIAIGGSSQASSSSGAKADGSQSIAIGTAAWTRGSRTIAIGYGSTVARDAGNAVQIGAGTNDVANSLRFRDTTVVNGNGKIPSANLDVEVAEKSDLRYAMTAPTVSGTSVTLDDRAYNYIDARSLGSSDTIDLDFPAIVDGKSRDFVLAVECGANPPAISYAAFVTIMAEDASSLTPESGMNIYAFTEFKPNMFLASRKLITTVVDNSPENGDQLLLAMQKRGIDTTNITDFGGVATALGLSDSATLQDAVDAVMN